MFDALYSGLFFFFPRIRGLDLTYIVVRDWNSPRARENVSHDCVGWISVSMTRTCGIHSRVSGVAFRVGVSNLPIAWRSTITGSIGVVRLTVSIGRLRIFYVSVNFALHAYLSYDNVAH